MSGGVTFSGGEPACHPEFIKETVSLLDGMNTAIETCGYAQTETFLDLLSHIDCIFMDIKLIDDAAHIKYTGKSNRLILENARAIAGAGRNVTFRVPLVPTVTDTEENLDGIAEFLRTGRIFRSSLSRTTVLPVRNTAHSAGNTARHSMRSFRYRRTPHRLKKEK